MDNKKEFKPYVPADKITPEITVTSIVMGVILAVVFGAANAYLGLRVGMTVSASIPAAVIAMGVIRIIMRKNSILESNIVQTVGSAGESLAAGAIFTLPALFLWAAEGKMDKPGILEITAVEYYSNETEDDLDTGIVGGLIEKIKDPNIEESSIEGDTFIKVKKQYNFIFNGDIEAEWFVDKKYPVKLTVDENNPKQIELIWDSSYSGQFELHYGNYSKIIVVESLF